MRGFLRTLRTNQFCNRFADGQLSRRSILRNDCGPLIIQRYSGPHRVILHKLTQFESTNRCPMMSASIVYTKGPLAIFG
jgi:hypothetical protein